MNAPRAADVSKDDLDQVLATVEIPTCPAMVSQVMEEARKEEPDVQKLTAAISSDVAMSAAVLKIANSAIYNARSTVENVQQAITRLGTKTAVSVAMGAALRSTMLGLPQAFVDEFWQVTITRASAATQIARRQYGISPDAAYTYALFQNAAVPLMLRRFPDYLEKVEQARTRGESTIEAERQFPFTHPIIGALLVRNWGLPQVIGQAIRFHHEDDVYSLQDKALTAGVVSLIAVGDVAEFLVASFQGNRDCEITALRYQQALDHLGINNADDLDAIREVVDKLVNRGSD